MLFRSCRAGRWRARWCIAGSSSGAFLAGRGGRAGKPVLAQAQLQLLAGAAHALPVVGAGDGERGADFIGVAVEQLFHAEHAGGLGRQFAHAGFEHGEELAVLQLAFGVVPEGGAGAGLPMAPAIEEFGVERVSAPGRGAGRRRRAVAVAGAQAVGDFVFENAKEVAARVALPGAAADYEIGRASCRERV